jgi:probable DNA metabolism protein
MKKNGMLFYLERSADCNSELFEYVKKEDVEVLESVSTELARKAYKMSREVGGDIHRAKAFTRLKVSKKGILYGELKIRHKVEDLVARFFVHRFPSFIVVLESWRGCFIYGKGFEDVVFTEDSMKSVVDELEKKVNLVSNLENVDTEKVWDEFYKSQYIPERKNLSLFSKNMPKKFDTWETENLQKNLGSKRLDEIV